MAEKSRPKKAPAAEAPAAASRAAGKDRDDAEHHVHSPTAVAGQAMSTGVAPASRVSSRDRGVPRDADLLQVGDVDTDPLQNAYVGDEAPGGDMATPDQDLVDELVEATDGDLAEGEDRFERESAGAPARERQGRKETS